MKLRSGKADWLDLEHMPLEGRRVRGLKVFEPRHAKSARAATLANRVVARNFRKHAETAAERVAMGADKVDVATYRDPSGKLRIVYREAIVRFEPGISQARRNRLLNKFGLKIRKRNAYDDDHVTVFDPRRKYIAESMLELCNELTETDEVEFAFPNFVSEVRRMDASPPFAAPRSALPWHLDLVGARKAWRHTRGEGITIAILDDGVDVDHPNLRRNIRRRPDAEDTRDLYGRDFFMLDDTPDGAVEHFDPRPKIFRFPFYNYELNDIHGTCCAGVAAASGDIGRVYGLAPRAKILPVKISHGDAEVTDSHVANAIRYATRHADIISCSQELAHSPDIISALQGGSRGRGGKGVPMFFAAGNESGPIIFPARIHPAIAVGASTYQDKKAGYSNFGRQLSIVAPSGVVIVRPFRDPRPGMILTTDVSYPRRGFNVGLKASGGMDGLSYNKFSGTSSSTPLAAGIAALMLSANPDLTHEDVRHLLEQTAEKIGPKRGYNKNGRSLYFGHGRVNAAKAVAEALRMKRGKAASSKKPD